MTDYTPCWLLDSEDINELIYVSKKFRKYVRQGCELSLHPYIQLELFHNGTESKASKQACN